MKALVVDDEHNALVALAKILLEDGHHVVVASNEEQAIDRLSRSAFDFVITDLFLVHGRCLKLLDKIKNLKTYTPVILTTGHENVSRYLDESSMEGMKFLSKPIKYEELKDTIAKIEAQSKEGRTSGSGR